MVNSKGGVGKTTTAVHLAAMLSRQGNTLLIDGDHQASAASWAAWRREKNYNPDLKVNILLTRIDARTKDTVDMLNFLNEQKLHVCHRRYVSV